MGRKRSVLNYLPLISGVVGIVCGLAWIAYGIFEGAFPKPLTIAFAVCNLINAFVILMSQCRLRKQKNSEANKESNQ